MNTDKISKFSNNQNWNIGFTNDTPETVISKKGVGKIHWMKHDYKDRFFADPFIYEISPNTITIFAEECEFENPKGRIVELVVDRIHFQLLNRNVLLENNFHLSYPAIIRKGADVYVCPENSASGVLNMYRYNKSEHSLELVQTISDQPLVDATMCQCANDYYLVATKAIASQSDAFLYKASRLDTLFTSTLDMPVSSGLKARPAGSFFSANNTMFRPSQNCEKRYGGSIMISNICQFAPVFKEEPIFEIIPQSFKYNLGIHTINFHNGVCVVDGNGYLYPIIGRLYNLLSRLKRTFIH